MGQSDDDRLHDSWSLCAVFSMVCRSGTRKDCTVYGHGDPGNCAVTFMLVVDVRPDPSSASDPPHDSRSLCLLSRELTSARQPVVVTSLHCVVTDGAISPSNQMTSCDSHICTLRSVTRGNHMAGCGSHICMLHIVLECRAPHNPLSLHNLIYLPKKVTVSPVTCLDDAVTPGNQIAGCGSHIHALRLAFGCQAPHFPLSAKSAHPKVCLCCHYLEKVVMGDAVTPGNLMADCGSHICTLCVVMQDTVTLGNQMAACGSHICTLLSWRMQPSLTTRWQTVGITSIHCMLVSEDSVTPGNQILNCGSYIYRLHAVSGCHAAHHPLLYL